MHLQLPYFFSLFLTAAVVATEHLNDRDSVIAETGAIGLPTYVAIPRTSLSDLVLVDNSVQRPPPNVGLVLGAIEAIGGLAAKTCIAAGVPAAIVCIATGMALIAGALAAIRVGLFGKDDDKGKNDIVQHFARLGMVAGHTGALIPDTSLLLAEHACIGMNCNKLVYLHNSTTSTKMLSVVPKMRDDGDDNDGNPGPGGLFVDYAWNNEIEGTELSIGEENATAIQAAVMTAYTGTLDNQQYANNGFYCASFFETNMGLANQGAVFQNQNSAFPFEDGEVDGVLEGCPA